MTDQLTSSERSNGSVEEQIKSNSSTTELTEVIPIQDTPFAAVRIESKYFLAMGKYRLTELYDTYEELNNDITNITWNRLTQVIAIICMEEIEKHTKATTTTNTTIQ